MVNSQLARMAQSLCDAPHHAVDGSQATSWISNAMIGGAQLTLSAQSKYVMLLQDQPKVGSSLVPCPGSKFPVVSLGRPICCDLD